MSDEGNTTSEATVSTVIDEIPTETATQVDTPIDLTEEEQPTQLARTNAIQGQNQNGGKSRRRKLRKRNKTRKHKKRITRRHKRRKHTRSRRH